MLEIRLDYRPTAKQALFHASQAHEVFYGGAAGGGKSRAIVMDALLRGLKTPGFQAYLFRRTYPELEDTLISEARRSIPRALGSYAAASHDLRLPNGSRLCFRHCQREKDIYLYQGAEMHALYVDELTHFTKGMYDYLKSRLRAPACMRLTPVARCAGNPGGVGHAWVRAYFVDAGPMVMQRHRVASRLVGERVRTRQFIPSLAAENPHITDDYLVELEQKPQALRRALLLGQWDAFEGQVFTEFVDDPGHYGDWLGSHVIEPFEIPAAWPRYRSLDWGYARPFSVGWWAAAPDGEVFRYREWYGSAGEPNAGLRMHPRQVAQGIIQREAEERRTGARIIGVADPAIWDASTGESVAGQMEREGVYFTPGDHARMAGKMQLHHRLAWDANRRAGMYIFRTCRDWLRTVPGLPYDPERPEDIDTRAEDHAYDETRYFLMARPVGPRERKAERERFEPLEL
ncbi:MAG: phage terminase large subunit [Oscillospiraceae bacterium]|jgi:hypothetical protein|nr:phage terminase large subunit [Oscillospiraceae bacterium]